MSNPTPFHDLHKALGANMVEYKGWLLPADYGDAESELAAMYQNAAAFDLSGFGRLAIGGPDARALIDGLSAADIGPLDGNRCIWSFICHKDGRLVDIIRLARVDNSYIVITSPGTVTVIKDMAVTLAADLGLDVKIADQTAATGMLGLYGPGAFAAIARILPFDIEQLAPGETMKISILIASVYILRSSWLGLDGIEVIGPAAACKLAGGAVQRYHKRENITPAGMEALQVAAIEASMPLVMAGQMLPEQLSPVSYRLGRLANFGKEFVGKEFVQEGLANGPGRILVGLKAQGKVHTHKNLSVQYDGMEIGWVDRLVWSARLGCGLGLAMVDAAMQDVSEAVQVVGEDIQMQAELCPLPFEAALAGGIWVD